MKLREILQTEIWSKKTSRKILVGFGKVLAVLVIVLVGFVAWYLLSSHWLTTAERNAGKAAMEQIDALQRFNEMSDAEYEAEALQAKREIDLAEQAARTLKDRSVYLNLDAYLALTDMDQKDKKFYREHPTAHRLKEINPTSLVTNRDFIRERLLKALK